MQRYEDVLKIENLSKYYGYGLLGLKRFKALDNISFEVSIKPPSIFAVVGETGSGKTTLLRIILKLVKPDEGRILYRGIDIFKSHRGFISWYRKEVQPIFQDPYESFNPLRRVDSYLFDVAKRVTKVDKNGIEDYVDSVLRYVGLSLDKVQGKYPHEFSGGELQRIAIARAIAAKPTLILADEPVSMLDASLRVNILNLFKKIKDELGTSIIYVTHDLATAYYIADQIAVLYRGSLVELGSIDKVYENPRHPYTQLLLTSILEPDPKISEKIKPPKLSTIELKEFLAQGCKFAYRCPYVLKRCFEEEPPNVNISEAIVKCWLYEKS
uniref:ABC transporter ATP-binding protein n=1 Tax=Ignisphaera aggregans TaxID=334771 RepID=A0A7C5UUU2_9CREN